MELEDALFFAPVYAPDTGAAAEEKVLIYFEQLFFPKVFLIIS